MTTATAVITAATPASPTPITPTVSSLKDYMTLSSAVIVIFSSIISLISQLLIDDTIVLEGFLSCDNLVGMYGI